MIFIAATTNYIIIIVWCVFLEIWGVNLTIKYRSERRSIRSFDSLEPIPEDIVRREMDKQKEANEKRFYDRETLNRDIANIRNRTSASLYNLLRQDECGVDSLNERINQLRDQRKLLQNPEISEVPKRKHILPFGFSRIQEDLGVGCDDFVFVDPWDFEYRYAFALGSPNIYVIADKPSGLMQVLARNDFESSDPKCCSSRRHAWLVLHSKSARRSTLA